MDQSLDRSLGLPHSNKLKNKKNADGEIYSQTTKRMPCCRKITLTFIAEQHLKLTQHSVQSRPRLCVIDAVNYILTQNEIIVVSY